MWMSTLFIFIPLASSCLNGNMMKCSLELVRVKETGAKALLLTAPVSHKRYILDMKAVARDCKNAFGEHVNRGIALRGYYEQLETRDEDKQVKQAVYILPEGIEREIDESEGGGCVLYSNCCFNDEGGEPPRDGSLKTVLTFEPGNDKKSFKFGTMTVQQPMAYVSCQIALDGTQEQYGGHTTSARPYEQDPDAYMAARNNATMADGNESEGSY